ncbi:MAG: SPOR domain-containing protein [Pseudomonadales bacterium]|nr:SPOR domain-containing protein [Pseudomonadales bacterium]
MTESNRNRIIGAMFLAGVLGIGLPFLFDTRVDVPEMDLEHVEPPVVGPIEMPPTATARPDTQALAETRNKIQSEFSEDGFLIESGVRVGDPVIGKADANTSIWAIQLASLSDLENAEALATKLRKRGYSAWISDIKRGSTVLHRVVVGPFTVRSEAVEISERLAEEHSVGPILVSFETR